jgi:hypothetical protein
VKDYTGNSSRVSFRQSVWLSRDCLLLIPRFWLVVTGEVLPSTQWSYRRVCELSGFKKHGHVQSSKRKRFKNESETTTSLLQYKRKEWLGCVCHRNEIYSLHAGFSDLTHRIAGKGLLWA